MGLRGTMFDYVFKPPVTTSAVEAEVSQSESKTPKSNMPEAARNLLNKFLGNKYLSASRLVDFGGHIAKLLKAMGHSQKQYRCVLCCSVCSNSDGTSKQGGGEHLRLGHKTSYVCSKCNLPLCVKSRFVYQGYSESCFQLFHRVATPELKQLVLNRCKQAATVEVPVIHIDQAETTVKNDKASKFKTPGAEDESLVTNQKRKRKDFLCIKLPNASPGKKKHQTSVAQRHSKLNYF